jgi:lipoprotein NlpI
MHFFKLSTIAALVLLSACANMNEETCAEAKAMANRAKNQAEQAYSLAREAQEEAEQATEKADRIYRQSQTK